jgi:hypothetical protein
MDIILIIRETYSSSLYSDFLLDVRALHGKPLGSAKEQGARAEESRT